MNWKRVVTGSFLSAVLAACVSPALCDEPADIMFEKHVMVAGPEGMMEGGHGPGPGTLMFLSSEFGSDRLVKGSPYSAEAVTERTQVLADGNRIVQKNSALVYRDSEGRTRREQQFGIIGGMASDREPPRSVFINDPVKQECYVLEGDGKTARKMPMRPHPRWSQAHGPEGPAAPPDMEFLPGPGHGAGAQVLMFTTEGSDSKTESLGKQFIEGIEAEGTRTTAVIPEGRIGNERPIEIVTEKWYSPELQVNVMTRHSDPRFGETVYRLQNILRSEPDPSLFQIPAGTKIEEGPADDHIVIRKKIQN